MEQDKFWQHMVDHLCNDICADDGVADLQTAAYVDYFLIRPNVVTETRVYDKRQLVKVN